MSTITRPTEYRLRAVPVSKTTREAFAYALPSLGNDLASWRLLAWRYFNGFVDEETGLVVVPAEVLALFEGKKHHPKHYSAETFLQRFRENITSIDLTKQIFWRGDRNKARQIIWLGTDEVLSEIVELEKRGEFGKEDRVDFVTGEPYNKPRKQKETAEECAWVGEFFDRANNPASQHILRYMQSLGKYRETYENQVKRQWDAAQAVREALGRTAYTDTNEDYARKTLVYTQQGNILMNIKGQPVPFVKTSSRGRTARLSPAGASWCGLKREIYKELTRGWDTLDLHAAQLAIVARLWDIPELDAF
ncbi:hypothetical protein SE17_24655, partial [Kouleothrix aurantiaca]